MKVYVGSPYALCLGIFYLCKFSITVDIGEKKKKFRNFYIAWDRENIFSYREDKILELIHGLNEKGIYPTIIS